MDQDVRLIPAICVLSSDVDNIVNFFIKLFDLKESECVTSFSKPSLSYKMVKLSNKYQTIMIVNQDAVTDDTVNEKLQYISTKHIYATVNDISSFQTRATSLGVSLNESNIDEKTGSICVFDGPENVLVHVIARDKAANYDTNELFINFLGVQNEEDSINNLQISPIADMKDHEISENDKEEIKKTNSTDELNLLSKNRPIRKTIIPTLGSTILSNNSKSHVNLPPNSRTPIPFETELFIGHCVLAVKTNPEDPDFKPYFMQRHVFEVQVQGRFKRMPVGEIFCGAEAMQKMELGLMLKTCARTVMNFASTVINDLHFSLGDAQTSKYYQLPHIVAPIFATVDKFVVTPPGKMPPPMGVPYVEDPAYRAKRLKFRKVADAEIDLNNIYSFSVNTRNIDLCTWNLVNFPMMRPMDMRSFFGDSPIRLVAYEIPHKVQEDANQSHPNDYLNYALCVKLTALDADKVVDIELDRNSDEENDDVILDRQSSFVPKNRRTSKTKVLGNLVTITEEGERTADETEDAIDEDEDEMLDAERITVDEGDLDDDDGKNSPQKLSLSPIRRFFNMQDKDSSSSKKTNIFSTFKKRINNMTSDITPQPVEQVPETAEYMPFDYDMENVTDLAYCPASIEINDSLRESRRIAFVLLFNKRTESICSSASNLADCVPKLRHYSEISTTIPMTPIPKYHKNKHLSQTEKRRRHIVESCKNVSDNKTAFKAINAALKVDTNTDTSFFNGGSDVSHHKNSNVYTGYVALAVSRRHWTEQYMKLTKTDVILCKHPVILRGKATIPLSSIICVRTMKLQECPMANFNFFQIETTTRTYYFFVHSARHLEDWLEAYTKLLGPDITRDSGGVEVPHTSLPSFNEIEEAYLAKPSTWKLDKRRIFNYRTIMFTPSSIPRSYHEMHPNRLIETILEKAFILSHSVSHGTSDTAQWISFMDMISVLQCVDISMLNETEKMAFLLNLYHVMILHGMIILGPPPSWNTWFAFFNTVTYLFSFEIVSISDVEHNLLRNQMSKPDLLANMYSKFIIPNRSRTFPGLSLNSSDFRLTFCINCGSGSMPKFVAIYKPESLDRQLDEAVKLHLAETVEIDYNKRVVWLPAVCKWYLGDFTMKKLSTSAATADALRVLAYYMRSNDRRVLNKLLADGTHPSVKFKTFNYRCRAIARHDEDHGDLNNNYE